MGVGKAPGFVRKPDYSLSTEAVKGTVRVTLQEKCRRKFGGPGDA